MASIPFSKDFGDRLAIFKADALRRMSAQAAPQREVSPFNYDELEQCRRSAYECHDTLMEMGGRPTRAVLEKLAGNAVFEEGGIRLMDNNGEPDYDFILGDHWVEESNRFHGELDRWKKFRDFQPKMEHQPPLIIAFDPEKTNQELKDIFNTLNDWREFQRYQQVNVGREAMLTWKVTRAMEYRMREEAVPDESSSSLKTQQELTARIDHCLNQLFSLQRGLEGSKVQLTWIESQISEILLEACASLEAAFPLQRHLETKLEQQVNGFYQELMVLEARPNHSVQSPGQSAGFAQRICHLGSEVSRLMHELWEWKIFLKWRIRRPYIPESACIAGQESARRSSELQIWVDYVTFRHYELGRARSWFVSWQRLLESRQGDLKTAREDEDLPFLQEQIAKTRVYLEEFQQDVLTAESHVRLAEQQLAELSLHQISSNTILSPPETSASYEDIPEERRVKILSSSPTNNRRISGSTESTVIRGSDFLQPSNYPIEKKGATPEKKPNINEEESATAVDVFNPNQGVIDDDTQMTEAPVYSNPADAVKECQGTQSRDLPSSDVELHAVTRSHPASELESEGRSTLATRKLPLPSYTEPTSRKTRSATKSGHAVPSRVLKNVDKKPVKKPKAFSAQQITVLLNAVSINDSSADSITMTSQCRPLLRLSRQEDPQK